MLEDEKAPFDIRRPPYRRRRWQLGMGMFIIANVFGSSVQISTLPLPVLSTLQASGLVFNSVCATLILSEPFTRWSLRGTLLVCSGALLIAIFGAFPAPAHKLDELLALMGRRTFVIWMILQGVVVLAMAITTDVLSCISPHAQSARFRLLRGLSYGCISGILSAHSLLVAKSAVELIIRTLVDGENQFVHWESWALGIALIVLALSQLHYLHRGLKLVSTSVLYPLVFCIYNIVAILDGLIYFRQTDLITPLRGCLIVLGTVILLAGVLALSWRLSDEQHAPAVGQSSLAPGLGLVEDTDEESSVGETPLDDEDRRISYSTFGSQRRPIGVSDSRAGHGITRRSEHVQIWDELDDNEVSPSPTSPRQQASFPAPSEHTSLLSHPRNVSEASDALPGVPCGPSAEPASPQRTSRRRRKSTGFPGFRARSPSKKRGLQDALGGMWKMKWWNTNVQPTSGSSAAISDGEDNVLDRGAMQFNNPLWKAPSHGSRKVSDQSLA